MVELEYKYMRISTDTDPELGYEINSLFKKLLNKLYIPLIGALPPSTRNFIKRTHSSAKRVIETATTHHAIEVLYKFGEPENSKTFFQKIFYYIWFTTDNSKAVRNRLRLVTKKLRESILEQLKSKNNIRILSVAAGSARAILDAISIDELKTQGAEVAFLDKNPQAHVYSKKLITERHYGENFKFSWILDTANNFPKYFEDGQPNIIEIVGLLDYFNKVEIKRLFTSVFENLEKGGIFITSNIVDNPERKFITNVVGWDMLYKTPEDFYEIALAVGFKDEDLEIIYEPLKVHFIMVARRS